MPKFVMNLNIWFTIVYIPMESILNINLIHNFNKFVVQQKLKVLILLIHHLQLLTIPLLWIFLYNVTQDLCNLHLHEGLVWHRVSDFISDSSPIFRNFENFIVKYEPLF